MHRVSMLAWLLLASVTPGWAQTLGAGDLSAGSVKVTGSTTARTLATRFPEVTAQDFNLTAGGGTADDTAAVQAAFNSGEPVFLIPGTYSVTCLAVPSGLTLRGAGPSLTKIVQRAGSSCATLTGTGAADVSISGVTVNANNNGTSAIAATSSSVRWHVFNNSLLNATQDCLRFQSGQDAMASGNYITGCGQHGITWASSASRFAATDNSILSVGGAGIIFSVRLDGSIKGNSIQNVGPSGDCITGYGAANLRIAISGNSCLTALNNGIHAGGTQLSIVGNNVYSPALYGVFVRATTTGSNLDPVAASTQVTVSANNVYNTTTANMIGIMMEDVTSGTVTGNTVKQATQHGIALVLSTNVVATGNHVSNSTGNGIEFRGTLNSIISGNLVTGVTGDAYRSDPDTSNDTGAGTVNTTGNTLVGNSSIGNGRDYIEAGAGTTSNYYAFNTSAGATGGTSPVITILAGSIWNGTAAGANDLQLATAGGKQVLVKDAAATINYVQLGGAATGGNPLVKAQGGDANRGLSIAGQGTAGVFVTPSPLVSAGAATLQNTLTATGLPTTCTAQPTKTVAAISGVLNLCP